MDGACAGAAGGGGSWWCLLVRGAPLANYGLVAHFPSCSPVVVVVVAHVFEQAASHSPSVCASPCLPSGKMSVCLCTLHHLSTLCPTGHGKWRPLFC
jgi:hypothetical protein